MKKSVKRIYVRKKDRFDYKSKEVKKEIENLLKIKLEKLNIYNRYDLEISDENLDKAINNVLSERNLDYVYAKDEAKKLENSFESSLAVEYLPGQFDQRRKGVLDTLDLILDEKTDCKTATVYEFSKLSENDLKKIENYLVNPVDSHKIDLKEMPESLDTKREKNLENEIYDGFIDYSDEEISKFLKSHDLAMDENDLKMVRDYFKKENRDPNETEIKILDTYWSDHCRHTTFNTNLEIDIKAKTILDEAIKNSFEKYLKMRDELEIKKPINLMSFGTILSKYMRSKNDFDDLEVSSEINACSVYVKVRVEKDGKENLEDYLLMFKNETHNHPTEIEPFGGASTCLGGAIRDPLSGRSYVYQAMRITGAGNILEDVDKTMEGKLAQRKISKLAAKGYSSYGNQIGLATGFVKEIFHEGYKAKRMECGAVIAAAPKENVKRLRPKKDDIVLLIGGRTGRDGIGGATGSSKSHKLTSIITESAQVQKGNAPEERKLQRLFRRCEVSKLIKKCNDFGAGGVSVAIGELYDGIDIDLSKVKLKYEGLKPSEIAISESQERMAVLIDKNDREEFEKYCREENVETALVGVVTDTNRMRMFYEDKKIADISYDFINTNGANRKAKVNFVSEEVPKYLKEKSDNPKYFYEKIKDLNVISQRNLIEIFDSTIGQNTVLQPLGGKKQVNPSQAMVAKIPVNEGKSKTVSIMSYGFDPYLSEKSQYLGGYYAVIESIAKLVSVGSDLEKIRLSFQEFYEKMDNEKSWSKPLKSLLGAFEVTNFFKMPPIGGKDSMSGSFEDLNVPPTLISFATTTEDIENIKSNDLKGKGKIGLVRAKYNSDMTLDLDYYKNLLGKLIKAMRDGKIISTIALDNKGILANIYEQALGNSNFTLNFDNLYTPMFGSFVVEYEKDLDFVEKIGEFSDDLIVNGEKLDVEKLEKSYLHELDQIFAPKEEIPYEKIDQKEMKVSLKSKKPVDKVKVSILAVTGTNCEWDTKKVFEKYGAEVEINLFRNLDKKAIEESIENLSKSIRNSQIFAIPGGFSMADEPDGSGKFLANIIRNKKIKDAIEYMLDENDGLIIGICNGFQTLIKTGLLPYGKIKEIEEDDPSLTYNTNDRHISTIVDTKVLNNQSPWTSGLDLEETYKIPISHGEGRFIVNEEKYKDLLENGQIFSVYEINPNGSDYNIEGILSKDGKILGRMGHVERLDSDLYKNIYDKKEQKIFENAINYFKK